MTDSRGRTAAAEAQIYVADYSPPVPVITALYRCDASGTAAPDGAWAKAELGCAVTSLGGQNTAACVLKYRVRGTESWTEKAVTVPGSTVFPADTGSDYQVSLCASDSFTTVTSGTSPLPAAFALLDFDRKDKALGIGQRAGTAGTLSIGLPIKMGANRITDLGTPTANTDAATKGYSDIAAYPVGAIYISADSTSPASLFGGTWAMITNRFLLAAGDLYEGGTTGGEAAHTLTVNEVPSHSHELQTGCGNPAAGGGIVLRGWSGDSYKSFSLFNTGGGAAHNNMPPYFAVYMWQRVA